MFSPRFKEWTLVEWIIVVAIGAILLLIALTAMGIVRHEKTQCIGGYLFTNPIQFDYKYPVTPVQILDSNGKGIRCEER